MKDRNIKIIALAALIIFGSSAAFASGIGTITSLEGSVDLFKAGSESPSAAALGSEIETGDSVRTKSASKAEITFADKSVVRLAEKTKLDISDYRTGDDGKRINAVLNVERGKIRAIISKSAAKDSFTINTPNAKGSVKGTDVVVVFQKSSTAVAVLNGRYSLSNPASPEKKVEIKGGEVSVVAADNEPSSPRLMLASEKKSHEADTSVSRSAVASSDNTDNLPVAEGYSQAGEMKAVIIKLAGNVRIKSKDSKTWHDAKLNETVRTGDSIETKANGKAEFKIENGNIITLQQNSNVTISRLSRDGKGEYENLFESTGGKIRAQVEKLKGNSKFEVKTPNAVACVRGTVLFLNILPNLTNAYFEEGNGVLRSIISGTTQNVPMGTGSTVDGNGNISNPLPPSDDQKSGWHEGWEFGGEAEGYSGPEGYTGGGTGDNENPDNGANNVFSDKPFTDIIGPGEGGDTGDGGGDGTVVAPVTMNGTIEGDFGYEGVSENNFFSLALSSTTPLGEQWSGTISVNATGTYDNPYYRVFIGNVEGKGVNGGVFYGWSGGVMHSWDTVVSSIYIDPSGMAGNLFGVLSGSNTVNEMDGYYWGDMAGNGDLYVIPMAQLEPDVEYGTVEGWGYGNLNFAFDNGNGYVETGFDRQMAKIEGQDWGIWREAHYGGYSNPNGLTNWSAVAGGDYNDGYFFSLAEGTDNLNGAVRFDISGSYLDSSHLGAYYGTILAHAGEGIEGTGAGGFVEQELSSSTELFNCAYSPYRYEYEYGDYDYDGYGGFDHAGHIGGLAGTVGDLWGEGGFYLVSIGEMEEDEAGSLNDFVWMTDFSSDDNGDEDIREYDGEGQEGAYYGLSSVTGKDGVMKGSARILYIDPDGYAGVKSGKVEGAYSSLAGAYMFDGDFDNDLNITPVIAGISAEDLSESIWSEESDGRLEGDYSGEGFIGGQDELYTASIVDYKNHTSYDWGIYSQRLTGEYELPAVTNGIFSAKMGGNDSFGCYNPGLSVNGQYQLNDGGYYYYQYNDNNSYGYTSEYHYVDNTQQYSNTNYYDDGSTHTYSYSYDNNGNLLGGTSGYGTWDTSVPLAELIGSAPEDASYLSYEDSYVTAENDYGYWIADVNGQGEGWFNGSLNGVFLTGTRMGTISGDIDGTYYDDGTWMGSGSGTWNGKRLAFSGYWGENESSLYTDDPEGYISWAGEERGLMGSTEEDWWDNKSFTARAIGGFWYDYDDGVPKLWNTEIESNNVEKNNNTTLDGGAYYGFTTGIWKNGLMSDGRVIAIFAAPDGRVGIMRGGAEGGYYEGIDLWQASMDLSTEMVEGYSYTPEGLRNDINEEYIGDMGVGGSFAGNGTIYGNIDEAYSYSLPDMPWGIFNVKMGGWFEKDDGNIAENGLALGKNEEGYGERLLITARNVVYDDNTISADVAGAFIDLEEGMIGRINGDLRGTATDQYYYDGGEYYNYTSWAGAAIGEWKKEPLAYSGIMMDGAFGYVEDYYGGFDVDYGYMDGVFGGSGNIWQGPADLTIIGGFWNPDYNEDRVPDYKLWASDFYIITDDNAVAYGTMGGTSLDNRLKGLLLSLYIRETDEGNRAGYIMSVDDAGNYDYFNGDFYPSIGMYGAEGKLAYFLDMPTDYDPTVLLSGSGEALDSDDIYGVVGGDIEGTLDGETLGFVDQDWGIWRAASSGVFNNPPENTWSAVMGDVEDDYDGFYSTYTLAFIDGTSWEDGGFSADIAGRVLSNRSLTTFNGKMLGAYDTEYNEWEALSLGVAQSEYLTLSGSSSGGIGYYGEGFINDGITYGNMGSTVQEWWANGPFDVVAMGEYEGYLDRGSYIVGSKVNSFNGYDGSNTTDDGEGAFWGWTVGTSRNGRLPNMYTAALFISPGEDGNQAGILRGSMNGNTFAMPNEYLDYGDDMEVGLWQADGTLTPTVMMNYIPMGAADFVDSIEIDSDAFTACGKGVINGNPLEAQISQASIANIEAYDTWGIVNGIMFAQSNAVVTDGVWQTALGGVVPDDTYDDSYLLFSAKGTSSIWDFKNGDVREGDVDGSFRGVYLAPEHWDSETERYTAMNIGRVEGDISGFYEAGVDTTIQAAFVGEWVDLAELDTSMIGFDNVVLAEMVSVPITETYSALLQGNGAFGAAGAITGNMDISFYAQNALDLNGIWAALFNGSYSGYTGGNDWNINYSNDAGVNATLTGTQWSEGQWMANVSGTAPGDVNFNGQAGGTYTGTETGTFEGAGAGTWNTGN
ncbi:MAG: FecR family protein [Candidatus Omnitrophota bacterium]